MRKTSRKNLRADGAQGLEDTSRRRAAPSEDFAHLDDSTNARIQADAPSVAHGAGSDQC